ncbi:hypothetical protein Tco_0283112 [Tanacetum coccineum]
MTLSTSSFRKRYISSYKTYSSLASLASSLTLPIRNRYQGTSKPILDIETEGDESEDEGTGSESEELEEEGPGLEGEEVAFKDQQQKAVLVEGTAADEPRGLGYKAARRRALELAEGPEPSTFEIGQSSRFMPDQQILALPEWSFGSLHVSPASLTVPSPIASLVTTPAATIAVDEDEFLEVETQLELHGSILHDHIQRLDALPLTLFEGYEDQREIHTLRMHHAADQCEMQGLRERVATLERRMDRLER